MNAEREQRARRRIEEYIVQRPKTRSRLLENNRDAAHVHELRAAMEAACEKEGIRFYRPSPIFCTDNAAMIGVAAYYEYQKGTRHGWDLNAVPNLKLGER